MNFKIRESGIHFLRNAEYTRTIFPCAAGVLIEDGIVGQQEAQFGGQLFRFYGIEDAVVCCRHRCLITTKITSPGFQAIALSYPSKSGIWNLEFAIWYSIGFPRKGIQGKRATRSDHHSFLQVKG